MILSFSPGIWLTVSQNLRTQWMSFAHRMAEHLDRFGDRKTYTDLIDKFVQYSVTLN